MGTEEEGSYPGQTRDLLWPQWHAEQTSARTGARRTRRRPHVPGVSIGPGGVHDSDPGLRQGRRPHPGRRQRLRADTEILRFAVAPIRRRDHLLRSAGRRRHCRVDAAEHAPGIRRIAGLTDLRGTGHPRDRRGRTQTRRHRDDGQHLGHAALLQALRARCGRIDPGHHQVHRRPFRRDHGFGDLHERGMAATEGGDHRVRPDRGPGRLLPGSARSAHHGHAHAGALGIGRATRAMDRAPARGRAGAAPGTSRGSGPCAVETRLPRRLRPVRRGAQADGPARRRRAGRRP